MAAKKRKKKLVSKLRFPEFEESGNWEEKALNNYTDRITKKVGDQILPPISITAGKGFVEQSKKFGRDISGDQYKNYIHITKGDFVYNRGNSKTFAQGCVYQLHEFNEAAASTAFICFKLDKIHVDEYFQNLFEHNAHGRKLTKFITSGARSNGLLNINATDFFSIDLPIPPSKEEQQKIADCLGSLDKLIAAHTAKLEALKDHKKGLLQKLFPAEGETVPELRFPEFGEEWQTSELGGNIIIKGRIGYRGYTVKDIVQKGEGPISLSPSNIKESGVLIFQKSTYISWEKYNESPEIMLEEGVTVLVKTGSTFGKAAYIDILTEEITINPQIVILKPKNIEPYFLFLLITGHSIQMKIAATVVGGAIPTLSQKNVSQFNIFLPSRKEQKRIAECFYELDSLVKSHSKVLSNLKNSKKGLMQQLFPISQEAKS